MTPKNRTLEGKNRTVGGRGGQKSSKIVGHHLCTFPYGFDVYQVNVKTNSQNFLSLSSILGLQTPRERT